MFRGVKFMETWEILIIASTSIFVLLLPCFVFRILIKPNKYREGMENFKSVRYAHRGLHNDKVPENSMGAFKLAVDAGYGIELDVRLSSDGELMVFHDDTLDRMTSECGRVDARTADELKKIKLKGSEETLPTLREVLKLVDGKVPLLIEMKEEAGKYGVTEKTVEVLKEYQGPFIVESFNPLALGRLKMLAPDVMRGFLSQKFMKDKNHRKIQFWFLQNMLFNYTAKPDFIAYRHSDYDVCALKFIKKHYKKIPLIAWTVESVEDDKAAIDNGFSGIIFQNYHPNTTVSGEKR